MGSKNNPSTATHSRDSGGKRPFDPRHFVEVHARKWLIEQASGISTSWQVREDAVDLTEWKLIQKLELISGYSEKRLKAYAHKILRNAIRKQGGRRTRRNAAQRAFLDDLTYRQNGSERRRDDPLDHEGLSEQSLRSLRRAIDALPANERVVAGLRFWRGMTYEELAEGKNVSRSTMWRRFEEHILPHLRWLLDSEDRFDVPTDLPRRAFKPTSGDEHPSSQDRGLEHDATDQ